MLIKLFMFIVFDMNNSGVENKNERLENFKIEDFIWLYMLQLFFWVLWMNILKESIFYLVFIVAILDEDLYDEL